MAGRFVCAPEKRPSTYGSQKNDPHTDFSYARLKAKLLFLFDYGDEWLCKVERRSADVKALEQYPAWEE